ncbi:MAG: zinc-finger domain-containing protein [Geminicoccaceae bacterium]|nr:zinc-finger domain-containing protein [Geminicoccaceae bacterium]
MPRSCSVSRSGTKETPLAEIEVYLLDDEEVAIVSTKYARCDGGGGVLGHPVEYLTLEKGGQTVCKYCDRRFVHAGHPDVAHIRRDGKAFGASTGAALAD